MFTVMAAVLFIASGVLLTYTQRNRIANIVSTKSERAYQQREILDYKTAEPWAREIGESFVKSERHKNFFKYAEGFPRTEDVVTVQIIPTDDGGIAVALIDVDGVTATYWMKGTLPEVKPIINGAHQGYSSTECQFAVRSITPY